MNFRHVEVFFTVMTEGSITAAANKLGISQPSVTTTIKQTEQSLGFQLFERKSGRLIPTPESRILYEEATRAHEALTAFDRLSLKLREGLAGTVKIAATSSLCLQIIPDAMAEFTKQYPHYSIAISTNNTETILSKLNTRSGTYHIGFTYGTGNYDGLSSTKIGMLDLYCILPSSWQLKRGSVIDFKDLTGKPYIASFPQTPLGSVIENLFMKNNIEPQTVATVHSHQLALELVTRGIGFSILDTITVYNILQEGKTRPLFVKQLPHAQQLPLTAIFPGGRVLSNPSRHFLDLVRKSYRSLQANVKQNWA